MFVEFENQDGEKEHINPHHVSRIHHSPGDKYTEVWLNNGSCIYVKGTDEESVRKLKSLRP